MSFVDISTRMGCSEEDVTRIFFRQKAALSNEATALAAALNQKPGTFDQFLSLPNAKPSYLLELGKSALERLSWGRWLLLLFFSFNNSIFRSEAVQRSITLANIKSDTLRNEATTLTKSFHAYVDGVVEFQEQRTTAPNDPVTQEKRKALQETYRIVKSSIDIIKIDYRRIDTEPG